MNLDILLHLIDVLPAREHHLLVPLGQTCRRAQAQAQTVRRAVLLSRVEASYRATLLHAEASLSEWPHQKGNGQLAEHVTMQLGTSQRELFEYLHNTYGLTNRFQCSTPLREMSRVVRGKILRLYDVQVKLHGKRRTGIEHENAWMLVSDLAFLSRRGYETHIFYYLLNAPEEKADSVTKNPFLKMLRQSKDVNCKENTYRILPICKMLEFRFELNGLQLDPTGLQM
jgi:hypothetical protein